MFQGMRFQGWPHEVCEMTPEERKKEARFTLRMIIVVILFMIGIVPGVYFINFIIGPLWKEFLDFVESLPALP